MARNFCWISGTSGSADKKCMEKHSAEDGKEFYWNRTLHPKTTKAAVLFYGQYCQSGVAFYKYSSKKHLAIC
jgi:hypothetical protein